MAKHPLSPDHMMVWHGIYIDAEEFKTEPIEDLRIRIKGDVANIRKFLVSDLV